MSNVGFSSLVLYFFLVGSIISLLASLISIIFYISNKETHILALRMVFQAQIANFLVSLTSCLSFLIIYTLGVDQNSSLCIAHSYFMNYFNFLVILLVSNISYVLYLSIFYPNIAIIKISNYCVCIGIMISAFLSLMYIFLNKII